MPKLNYKYVKFTNFSEMRNLSLELNKDEYSIWCDVDDVVLHMMGIKDIILFNPDIDVFRFQLHSRTELGTEEMIFHTNLFKNKREYRFRGRVHEDILPSMNESGAKLTTTNITIQHLGYLNLKTWKEKNLRNYKLLLLDLQDSPHSLTYYHIVNCLLIIGGHENMLQAVKYVDECLEKFQLKKEDPLTPKMWVLRGVACMDAKQDLAAKQSFHKAYDEWQHPEAAVNLAELYLREKNYDKVLEILKPIYELKEFPLSNIPMDVVQAECMMLQKMGEAYYQKAMLKTGTPADVQKAEQHFREHLTVRQNLMVIDRLCQILRNTGRQDEAAFLTRNAVNKFRGYYIGWQNLGVYEIDKKCYGTAKLFLKECLRLKPGHPEAKHNLNMIENIERSNRV
jgi:tetratricopeptide (TPR) repeat protein